MTLKFVVGECIVLFKLVLCCAKHVGYFQGVVIRENAVMSCHEREDGILNLCWFPSLPCGY